MMAFKRSGEVHKLFLVFVTSFLSPYASPGKEYVHLDCSFILLTIKKPGVRGKKHFFGVFRLTQLAMFGGSTIPPKEASLS